MLQSLLKMNCYESVKPAKYDMRMQKGIKRQCRFIRNYKDPDT